MGKIFLFVLGMLVFVKPAEASAQKQAAIQKIENYFDHLKTLQADLVQINPDRSLAKGKFYWQRPEKFRIQYTEPKDNIFVSDGRFFIEYDPKEDMPNFISLESTPASLFLKDKLRLSGDVSVRHIEVSGGHITVVLYKTQDPDVGNLTMVFEEKPMKLVHWIIHDAQGNTTEVSLKNIVENQPINESKFATSRVSKD